MRKINLGGPKIFRQTYKSGPPPSPVSLRVFIRPSKRPTPSLNFAIVLLDASSILKRKPIVDIEPGFGVVAHYWSNLRSKEHVPWTNDVSSGKVPITLYSFGKMGTMLERSAGNGEARIESVCVV